MPDTPREPAIIHLHWVAFARDIGAIATAVFVPLLLTLFMRGIVSGPVADTLRHTMPLLAALWAVIIWITCGLAWAKYYLSLWVITDKHVVQIEQTNIIVRKMAAWDIASIKSVDIATADELSGSLGYGTIWIQTPQAVGGGRVMAAPIPEPEVMREEIAARMTVSAAPLPATATAPAQAHVSATDTSELVRSISHEVKGHLTRSQVTFAAILSGDFGEVPAPLKELAGKALADTREGVETVMDILNSANIKKGTLMMQKETFDLLAAIREQVAKFKPEAAKKGLVLRFTDQVGSCLMEGDRQKLDHHVFRNLLDNSIHYTQTGEISVDLKWDMSHALLTIADTGVGISPEDMSRLFTEGGKGKESSRVNPASTGYGLYVAKLVVEGHGGQIWAESEGPGKGSRFYVKLPLHG